MTPENSYTLPSPEGFLDLLAVADSRADFEQEAKEVGLFRPSSESAGEPWVPEVGVTIDHVGPVLIKPGLYGVGVRPAEREVLRAPEVDSRHHVNIRLSAPYLNRTDLRGDPEWRAWLAAWADDSGVARRVQAIDPASIHKRARLWLEAAPRK